MVIALWVLLAHTYEAFSLAPYLAVLSPVKGCGKSTVLDVIELMVPRPLKAEGFTAAVIYRVIEKYHLTLLVDELDSFLTGNEILRSVLNSGYSATGKVARCVGDEHEPQTFRTFGPKVLALIGELPPTVEDRSIVIRMERKLADEQAESLSPSREPTFLELKRRCIRWAEDHREILRDRDPDMEASVDFQGKRGPTKTRKPRSVELSTRLREALPQYRPDVFGDDSFAFPSQAGSAMEHQNFRSRVFNR
ncbi:DUF3631 domain-containing protein [Myxococcota bacterium]|nr:DUF3631 domain-containing protein [Myxococcota bacterium]